MGAVHYLLVLSATFSISVSFIFEHPHARCQTSLVDAFPGCAGLFNDTSTLQQTMTDFQKTLENLKKDIDLLSVRLVNGTTYSGDVELFVNGYWGAICDESWDQLDADVVCRMIGYNRSRSVRTGHVTNAPYTTSNVACTGAEDSIFKCTGLQSNLNFGCDYNRAAGVDCEMGIRLAGSTMPDRGRIEVQHKGEWGTICDPHWTAQDAEVACRMLGMRGGRPVPHATFGAGSGRVILSNILCYGAESHLMECRHIPFRVHTCDHTDDVGVVCDK